MSEYEKVDFFIYMEKGEKFSREEYYDKIVKESGSAVANTTFSILDQNMWNMQKKIEKELLEKQHGKDPFGSAPVG